MSSLVRLLCRNHRVAFAPSHAVTNPAIARRHFSTDDDAPSLFKGPIPRDRIGLSFSRSGGPGGQNVNKVNTKVELRFNLNEADWLPIEVRNKLRETEANRITRDDDFVVTSTRYRTQKENLEDAHAKIAEIISRAAALPRETTEEQKAVVQNLARVEKERKLLDKKARSEKREGRSRRGDDF